MSTKPRVGSSIAISCWIFAAKTTDLQQQPTGAARTIVPSSIMLFFTIATLLINISSVSAQESRYNYSELSNFGVYQHVYPPTNIALDVKNCIPNETVTCPLFVAVLLSFNGSVYNGSGNLLGVQIALDQINDNPTMLPGYRLHYVLKDSQVMYVRIFIANVLKLVATPPLFRLNNMQTKHV